MAEIIKKRYEYQTSDKMYEDYKKLSDLILEKTLLVSEGTFEHGGHISPNSFHSDDKSSFLVPGAEPAVIHLQVSRGHFYTLTATIDDKFVKSEKAKSTLAEICDSIRKAVE
ncbi:MAG: hypothetical protein V1886_02070 [archaeon]